ncbi:hypothetical protein [Amycolatopsis sp. cmx-4-68]|uniref:hypothetical protein n=1 Tax=Amycolatopsis sp. cmx-4-68 TaxID=2790938 RepID=UPI00397B5020
MTTTEFVTAEGGREVPSGFASITLAATAAPNPGKKSVIVVPGVAGGLSMDPALEGGIGWLLAAAGRSELRNRLREALAGPDAAVATVCGGSMLLLGHAGLADGRPLVTHERGRDLAGAKAVSVEARMLTTATCSTPATSRPASTWPCTAGRARNRAAGGPLGRRADPARALGHGLERTGAPVVAA